MSATLTWQNYGLGTKGGTAIGNLIDDIDTLVTSKSADPLFKWQTAGKNSGGTSPQWWLGSRKDGSAGRIALLYYSSSPASVHPTLFEVSPSTTQLQGVYFPSGTANTLSNLTASSGTICGVDTNAVKAAPLGPLSTIYTASFQPFVLETNECMGFFFQNPAAGSLHGGWIGEIFVDAADNSVGGVFGPASGSYSSFASSFVVWVATGPQAGAATAQIRTNHPTLSGHPWFIAHQPGGWASQGVGAPALFNGTSNKVEIPPIPLRPGGTNAGVIPDTSGFPLKLRQIGYGPAAASAFAVYNVTGPTVQARQVNAATVGGAGYPWVVNTKN